MRIQLFTGGVEGGAKESVPYEMGKGEGMGESSPFGEGRIPQANKIRRKKKKKIFRHGGVLGGGGGFKILRESEID